MIILILLLGFISNTFAYANVWPTISFLLCFILSKFIVRLFFGQNRTSKNRTEDNITIWLISLCYLFSGITELLIIIFDSSTNVVGPDATRFFETVSDPLWDFRTFISESISGYDSETLIGFKEDFLPLIIWNKIYYFLDLIKYPTGRYIGSATNTFLLLLTSYIGLDIARNTLKVSKNKEILYQLLICSNGMFLMYGSLHLRESAILLLISLSIYLWIKWIHQKGISNSFFLILFSVLSFYTFDFFRNGLNNIPLIFLLSFFIAILIKSLAERKIIIFQLLFLALPIIIAISQDSFNVQSFFTNRFNTYAEASLLESSSDSLGAQLIISQPIPIRLFTSVLYILFNPFPIWAGQGHAISAYHFFKSLFAFYNYFTFPGIILIINNQLKNLKTIDEKKLFLTISFILITILLGLTSMETRHLGGFYLIYILILLDFDFSSKLFNKNYLSLLSLFFLLLFVAYMLYIFYKFRSILLLMIFIGSAFITFAYVNKNKLKRFTS